MRTLFGLILCAALASAAPTRVTGTITYQNGNAARGYATVTNDSFTGADNTFVPKGSTTFTLASDGSFIVDLTPNATGTNPPLYTVKWTLQNAPNIPEEKWLIPVSASPVSHSSVRITMNVTVLGTSTLGMTYGGTGNASWTAGRCVQVSADGSKLESSSGACGTGAGSGSVTSVGFTPPSEFLVSGSPITSSGTITMSKANQTANYVWAGPTTGSAAAPTFRALVAADIPNLSAAKITSGSIDISLIPTSFGLVKNAGNLEVDTTARTGYSTSTVAGGSCSGASFGFNTGARLHWCHPSTLEWTEIPSISDLTPTAILAAEKAAANGVATLDSNTRVPVAQLGSGTANSTKYLRGDGAWEAVSVAQPVGVTAASGTINFGVIAAGRCSAPQTFTANGYPSGTPVTVNQPLIADGFFAFARISADNTASVVLCENGSSNPDPSSATFVVSTGTENAAGTSLPGTCAVGETFIDTDATAGSNFYACLSANTWQLQGGGGVGGGVADPGSSGIMVRTTENVSVARTITGTANEITVTNGNGASGNPTLSFPVNVDLSGRTSFKIPVAAGAAPTSNGDIRYDSTSNTYKGGTNSATKTFAYTDSNITGTAGSLSATLPVSLGGTGATTLTGIVKGNGSSAFSAASAGTDYSLPSQSYMGVESVGAYSFNDTTHILEVASITYWFNGVRYTTASPVSADIDTCSTLATNTLYYFYFSDATGAMTCGTSVWNLKNVVPVATVTWNGTSGAVMREPHGYARNIDWQIWAHTTIGVMYGSGLSLTAPTTAADATLTIESGSIRDEDLTHTITQQTTMRGLYKASASIYTWADYSLPYLGTSGQPQYLDTDTYTLVNVSGSNLAVYWVYGTNDIDRPVYVIPTHAATAYATLANARAETAPSLSGLNVGPEMKLIYRFIFRGDGEFQESNDYRLSSPVPSGGVASTTAGAVSFVPSGTVSSATVQSAIEELDTEKGLPVTAQDSGGSSLGTITAIKQGASTSFSVASNTLTVAVDTAALLTLSGTQTFTGKTTTDLSFGTGFTTFSKTNAGTTGTTLNRLAKIDSSGNAVIATTSDTDKPLWVVAGGAGTTGSASLVNFGRIQCYFDAAATRGQRVVASGTAGGQCEAVTTPADGEWVLGYVDETTGGAGLGYMVAMSPWRWKSDPTSLAASVITSGTLDAARIPAALSSTTSVNGTSIGASKTILYTDTAAGSFPTLNQNTTGSAASLTTARNIGGVSFNGTADIVPQTVQTVDSTDSTSYVSIFDAATGNQQPKTDAGLTYNASTGVLTATGFSGPLTGAVTGNASTATTLATPRAIYGNNFDGSAALTQIIASTYGGTGSGFTEFTGPDTAKKTFTLPNASATILTTNAAVTVAQGGTGATTLTGIIKGNGTSAFTAATAGDADSLVSAASDTTAGKVELATTSETSTGTDTGRAVTPDGLAGSVFGEKTVELEIFAPTTDTATGDGKVYFVVPQSMTGMNLVNARAQVITAGTTNTTIVQLARCATAASGNACSGTVTDMLSTRLTVDSGENSSDSAATAAVIDTAADDVATGQIIRVDVDQVSTTAAKGLLVILTFRLP